MAACVLRRLRLRRRSALTLASARPLGSRCAPGRTPGRGSRTSWGAGTCATTAPVAETHGRLRAAAAASCASVARWYLPNWLKPLWASTARVTVARGQA